MQKIPSLIFGIAFLGIGGATLLGYTFLQKGHSNLAPVSASKASSGTLCSHQGAAHVVDIQNNQASPLTTEAKLCDKLQFVNHDAVTREIAFGPHEDHVPYDGVAERILGRNQSFTITLNQAGLFHYHDHAHDEVAGYFSVSKQ